MNAEDMRHRTAYLGANTASSTTYPGAVTRPRVVKQACGSCRQHMYRALKLSTKASEIAYFSTIWLRDRPYYVTGMYQDTGQGVQICIHSPPLSIIDVSHHPSAEALMAVFGCGLWTVVSKASRG